jgi:hypothetical protein
MSELKALIRTTMLNLSCGIALILVGLVWLRRWHLGEKAGAIITLNRPDALLMNHRERKGALLAGTLNVMAGILEVLLRLRHFG